MDKPWRSSQIDAFLQKFFRGELPSTFRIDSHSPLVSIFLKNRATQRERVGQLINKLNRLFLLDETIQRIIVRSKEYRSLIDQFLQDTQTEDTKIPGFHIPVLNSSSCYLTGKQQDYLTKTILHDFLQVNRLLEEKQDPH